MDANKLRFEDWFSILQQHSDDFLKISIEFVQGLALRVRSRKTRDKPDEKLGMRATFYDCGKRSHDLTPTHFSSIINLQMAVHNRWHQYANKQLSFSLAAIDEPV